MRLSAATIAMYDGSQRHFEQVAEYIRGALPGASLSRTRDAIQIDADSEDDGITVLLTPEAIEVRLPTVDWVGPHTPVLSSRLWKRELLGDLSEEQAVRLCLDGLAARRAEFRRCRYCGRSVPPEHMQTEDVCAVCAERHLGIIH